MIILMSVKAGQAHVTIELLTDEPNRLVGRTRGPSAKPVGGPNHIKRLETHPTRAQRRE